MLGAIKMFTKRLHVHARIRKRPRVRNQSPLETLLVSDRRQPATLRSLQETTGDSDKSQQHRADISWYDRTTPATLSPRIFLISESVCCLCILRWVFSFDSKSLYSVGDIYITQTHHFACRNVWYKSLTDDDDENI